MYYGSTAALKKSFTQDPDFLVCLISFKTPTEHLHVNYCENVAQLCCVFDVVFLMLCARVTVK
jgi:hypothetical protein